MKDEEDKHIYDYTILELRLNCEIDDLRIKN